MRHLMTGTALALITMAATMTATAALAEDVALLLGTGRYDDLDRLSRGTEAVNAADALDDMGFEITVVSDADATELAAALQDFSAGVPGAERLVVVLSGRFVTDGERTWYLAADTARPEMLVPNASALSIESLMEVMSRVTGASVLLLGTDPDEDEVFDAWLSEGIGALDIPQGITVIRGLPRDIARFTENELVEPEGDLTKLIAANRRVTAEGYLPRSFIFMGPEPAAVNVTPPVVVDAAAEDALWRGSQALDTTEAYRNYLSRYPNGPHAAAAEAAIAAIIAEPNRSDRLGEEALNLSRDERREIQRDLSLLEYNTRGIDGIFGPGTRGAITNWQQENGYAQTSYLTSEQIARLDAQAARRAAELEALAERQAAEQARLDRAFWDETGARGDEPGLRAYLERYPDGIYSETASEALAAIEAQKRAAAQAQDRAAWDSARSGDTVASYTDYLTAFPNGTFKAEAEARIAELQRASSNTAAEQAAQAGEAALALNPLTSRLVEAKLNDLGLNPGEVDGEFDDDTRRAIRRYQRDRSLPVSGYLNEATVVRLLADSIGVLR